MIRNFFIILTTLLLVSCNNKNKDQPITRFHDDGRAKPVVTIVPVMDSSSYEIPWSISDEFTAMIKDRLSKQGDLYLQDDENFHLSNDDKPFASNINWMKKSLKPTEFVVFLELVEHEDVPLLRSVKDPSKLSPTKRDAFNLNVSMRLRIVDLRGDSPKIVLQELLKDSYYVSNYMDKVNYNLTQWGTEEYKTSPMGMAHAQLSKNIIERINDYVMLSKSL